MLLVVTDKEVALVLITEGVPKFVIPFARQKLPLRTGDLLLFTIGYYVNNVFSIKLLLFLNNQNYFSKNLSWQSMLLRMGQSLFLLPCIHFDFVALRLLFLPSK